MAIPKHIYQSDSTSNLPPELLENIENIRALNPGWKYQFFDDEKITEFIRQYYGSNILDLYQKINPIYGAARADLFRYLLIYKFEGVWLDIKSSVNVCLDEVIKEDDHIVFSQWESRIGEAYQGMGQVDPAVSKISGGELQQWHIIAEPNNPYIKAVVNQVLNNINNYSVEQFGVGKLGVLRVTGPTAYTLTIANIFGQYPYRMADSNRILKLDYSIYLKDSENIKSGLAAHKAKRLNHYSDQTEPIVL